MRNKSVQADTLRKFWDDPTSLSARDMPELFHKELFNRYTRRAGNSNLSSGDPAFPSFPPVIEAANKVLYDGNLLRRYHNPVPKKSLLLRIAPFFKDLGIHPGHALQSGNIAIGFGVTNLYSVIVKKLTEDCAEKYPGKTPVILMTAPTYGIYAQPALYNDAEVKSLPLSPDNNWELDPIAVRHKISDIERSGKKKVVAFYNMNPHNPTGRVYTRSELEPVCEELKKKDVFVIDDMIYHGSEFKRVNKSKICPVASIPGMFDHCITLYGLGKAFGAADLRAGVACGTKEDVDYINEFIGCHFLSVPLATQEAIAAALSMEDYAKTQREAYFRQNAAEYEFRYHVMKALVDGKDSIPIEGREMERIKKVVRTGTGSSPDVVDHLLNEGIPGMQIINTPEAGYFAVADFSKIKGKFFGETRIDSITKLAALFIDQAKVLILPSASMRADPAQDMTARISFGLAPEAIAKSLNKMKNCIEQLTEKRTPGKSLELSSGISFGE